MRWRMRAPRAAQPARRQPENGATMTTNSTRRDSPLPPSDATSDARIRLLPLLVAIAVMLGITAWPGALANAEGVADHGAAMALFWSMSAGFVSGVGFRPRLLALRLLFSPAACLFALALAGWQVWTA